MQVLEQFVAGKGDPRLCEDAVVVTDAHAAVVDGATDVTGRRYDGVAGGRWAMRACVQAIEAFPGDIDARAAVATMTRGLAARVDAGLPAAARPCASVTIYSARHRQVWQIGDVGFHYPGLPRDIGQPRKLVDLVAAQFRAAVIAAADAAGDVDLEREDPGRIAARALISRQGALRNTVGPYGYAGIDGRAVPHSLVFVRQLPDAVHELVLASDGYPDILPTLAASEALLARLLAEDPRCVGALQGTKGLERGQQSYDDRAYLRLRV